MDCPKCGTECHQDSVHNGIGVVYGPWGCPGCCWSEDSEYDLSTGKSPFNDKGGMIDQYGSYYPPGNPIARMCFAAEKRSAASFFGANKMTTLIIGIAIFTFLFTGFVLPGWFFR